MKARTLRECCPQIVVATRDNKRRGGACANRSPASNPATTRTTEERRLMPILPPRPPVSQQDSPCECEDVQQHALTCDVAPLDQIGGE